MGDSNIDGDGGEVDGDGGGVNGDGSGFDGVDGDGSRGTSPSWQSARTETSIPRNWSSMAATLWNFTGRNADPFRVFYQRL
jgi:hypothetical protein